MISEQSQEQQHGAAGEPLGLRLRHAREGKGLSTAEVGQRMRLPVAIVEAMEREDFDRLGAPVYARGHLTGYARLVGVPVVAVESALRPAPPPPLTTTARVSRSHFLFERYARRAVYVVLTASIVLPVVWLATRDQLPGRSMVVSTLDATTEQGGAEGTGAATAGTDRPATTPGPYRDARAEGPVIASLTPFYREGGRTAAPQPPEPPAPVVEAPAPSLHIEFIGPSWVEVVARDGSRLEFGLVSAGEQRRFPAERVASVSIGDADAVSVRMDGESLDLAPFRRAKVARFTLSSDGELNPAGG